MGSSAAFGTPARVIGKPDAAEPVVVRSCVKADASSGNVVFDGDKDTPQKATAVQADKTSGSDGTKAEMPSAPKGIEGNSGKEKKDKKNKAHEKKSRSEP